MFLTFLFCVEITSRFVDFLPKNLVSNMLNSQDNDMGPKSDEISNQNLLGPLGRGPSAIQEAYEDDQDDRRGRRRGRRPLASEHFVAEEITEPTMVGLMAKNRAPGHFSPDTNEPPFMKSEVFQPTCLTTASPPLTITQRTANSLASLAGMA